MSRILVLLGRTLVLLCQLQPLPSRITRRHLLMEPQEVFRKRGGFLVCRSSAIRLLGLIAVDVTEASNLIGRRIEKRWIFRTPRQS